MYTLDMRIMGAGAVLCASGGDFRRSYVHHKPEPRTAPPNIGISPSQSRRPVKSKGEGGSRKKK
jgi:hypothetical protein